MEDELYECTNCDWEMSGTDWVDHDFICPECSSYEDELEEQLDDSC